jgi:hypothetical protein
MGLVSGPERGIWCSIPKRRNVDLPTQWTPYPWPEIID